MTNVTRREFLTAGGISAAFVGLGYMGGHALNDRTKLHRGFGPLVKDPKGILDLPAGFSYVQFSNAGEIMDDGLRVPAAHDGMAAFAGPIGKTILVRNHELVNQWGPWGDGDPNAEQLAAMHEKGRIGEKGSAAGYAAGGTSTLVFDTERQTFEKHWMSLAGTIRNCAGGPTPWGTWLTCEEAVFVKGQFGFEQDHGYVYEVPAEATPRLVPAKPIKPMGRMNREACAVDPETGVVYMTEDRSDSVFYRYIPNKRGVLMAGGRLQALKLTEHPQADTSNFGLIQRFAVGSSYAAEWVDVDARSNEDDLRFQGYRAGAAQFVRGEGMWWGDGGVVFACTKGGPTKAGQIWRYEPSRVDPTRGTLRLLAQPSRAQFENIDNLCVAPWGDVLAGEDGPSPNRIVGVTPEGEVYHLVENVGSQSEFAGLCFSPDGTTLFFNLQAPGSTFAVRGPWWHRARPNGGA